MARPLPAMANYKNIIVWWNSPNAILPLNTLGNMAKPSSAPNLWLLFIIKVIYKKRRRKHAALLTMMTLIKYYLVFYFLPKHGRAKNLVTTSKPKFYFLATAAHSCFGSSYAGSIQTFHIICVRDSLNKLTGRNIT